MGANYAQENVALDHQMQRQMRSEQVVEMDEVCAPKSASSMFSYKGASKSKKEKARKGARNDQFSSAMYSMKSRAKKREKIKKVNAGKSSCRKWIFQSHYFNLEPRVCVKMKLL